RNPHRHQPVSRGRRPGRALEPNEGEPQRAGDRADSADHRRAGPHLDARRQRRLSRYRYHALAHAGAVLHAANNLLPDEAALAEGDAVELVEVGLVGKSIAEGIVLAALGHTESDAVRVIVLRRGIEAPDRRSYT